MDEGVSFARGKPVSEFLQQFRAQYPEYNDLGDTDLTQALHQKYQAEQQIEIPFEHFTQAIGFAGELQPAPESAPLASIETPLQQQPLRPVEQGQSPSMLERVNAARAARGKAVLTDIQSYVKGVYGLGFEAAKTAAFVPRAILDTNIGKGIVDRSAELGADFLSGARAIREAGAEADAFLGKQVDPDEVNPPYLMKAEQFLRDVDMGYEQEETFEDVKQAFQEGGPLSASAYGTALKFGLKTGAVSVPDMVAAMYGLPAYILSRSKAIGDERAVNKGKGEAELVDMLEAAPFAIGSSVLDRIGAKGVTTDIAEQLGKDLLEAGFANAAKRVVVEGSKGASKEAATEAVQEGMLEYLGERLGTDAKLDSWEALDRAAAGALSGGTFGGAVSAGVAATKELEQAATAPKEPSIDQVKQDVDALALFKPDQSRTAQEASKIQAADAALNMKVESKPMAIDKPGDPGVSPKKDTPTFFDPPQQQEVSPVDDVKLQDTQPGKMVKAVQEPTSENSRLEELEKTFKTFENAKKVHRQLLNRAINAPDGSPVYDDIEIAEEYLRLKNEQEEDSDLVKKVETAGFEWKKNKFDEMAWFKGENQVSGGIPQDRAYMITKNEITQTYLPYFNLDEDKVVKPKIDLKDQRWFARVDRMYRNKTNQEIEAKIQNLDATAKELQKAGAREFNGMGGRRSGAAMSAQGARDTFEERNRLQMYLDDRQSRAEFQKDQVAEASKKVLSLKSRADQETKASKNADKLVRLADSIESKATEKLNQSRQTNTPKRAREAASAIETAHDNIALSQTLRQIAAKSLTGDIEVLSNLSSGTQYQALTAAIRSALPRTERGQDLPIRDNITKIKMPTIGIWSKQVEKSIEAIEGKKGVQALRQALKRIQAVYSRTGTDTLVDLTVDEAKQLQLAKKKGWIDKFDHWLASDRLAQVQRLNKMGIASDEQLQKAALELADLRVKPKAESELSKRERELVGKKIDGFFPTPVPVIQQMLDVADIQDGDTVLEPSAGKGNIVDELIANYPDIGDRVDVVEQQQSLRAILKLKGYKVVGNDFLETTKKYDKIIMNPPFEKFQDIQHVKHAYTLLKEGGTLVSIMGAGVKNSRAKAVEFRDWVDYNGGYIEDLPAGSFKDSERSTGVGTVMLVMHKPLNKGSLAMANAAIPVRPQNKSQEDQAATQNEGVYNAPGSNYMGLYKSLGIPPRYDTFIIDGKVHEMPEKPQRHEPIMHDLIKMIGRRIYQTKIKGKSRLGFYRLATGEIRTKAKNDVEVLAHELAHYLDDYSNVTLPNFQKLYRSKEFKNEVMSMSYTDANPKIQKIEGFAEFVRHWLTNSAIVQERTPKFYKAFNTLLAKDKKLNKQLKALQLKMHRFYLQGPDRLGQALIGKDQPIAYTLSNWAYRRDSRMKQQAIDRFHAARIIEQSLTGKIGEAKESAWKMLRLAHGGAEGVAEMIMNDGTVEIDSNGDIVRNGESLYEVLVPVKSITKLEKHRNDTKLDLLMRYFVARRSYELRKQGRERLIPKETTAEWLKLGKEYPVFESIHARYQEFNDRLLNFYVQTGILNNDTKKKFKEMNANYVPFNRVRDGLQDKDMQGTKGFQRLLGGTGNLNDIIVNIQDGITSNVKAGLSNRAKQVLYTYVQASKDGSFFASKLAPDVKQVKVMQEQMTQKVTQVFANLGFNIMSDLGGNTAVEMPDGQLVGVNELVDDDMLAFWQVNQKPTLGESGNYLDTVLVGGKPQYFEIQDPLLHEMLISMNPHNYGVFMNTLFGVKNFFTAGITLGAQFILANFQRDTIGAWSMSKSGFTPVVDSLKGIKSYLTKDEYFKDFMRNAGGYSSRIAGLSREGKARRRVQLQEFGVMSPIEKAASVIDAFGSAIEYGTRIGEYIKAVESGVGKQEAAFRGREISTDFSAIGASPFITGYIRTVPFLNAMIQSQDRLFREIAAKKKYDGNPFGFAMKGFLGVTIPTLALWLLNRWEDEDAYNDIPLYERRTNWHIPIGNKQYIKIPRPYDVGFAFGTMPELMFEYIAEQESREFADGMAWTMTQMYGVDGMPAMLGPIYDLAVNEKWTGSPVVPETLAGVSPVNQYNANTSETFVNLGKMSGMSPVKAEFLYESYTGYIGSYMLWASDLMLWDEEKLGPKPDRKLANNIFLQRNITPAVRPSTRSMQEFFDLKEQAERVYNDFSKVADVRDVLQGRSVTVDNAFKDDVMPFVGLKSEEKQVLFGLKSAMDEVSKLIYDKESGLRTAELAIRYNKNLTAEEKREQMDKVWQTRAIVYQSTLKPLKQALKKAREAADKRLNASKDK